MSFAISASLMALKGELALALGARLEPLKPRLHVGKTCGEACSQAPHPLVPSG